MAEMATYLLGAAKAKKYLLIPNGLRQFPTPFCRSGLELWYVPDITKTFLSS